MTVQDIYNQTVRPLSPSDRLRLATLILSEIAVSSVDISDRWNDDDYRDFSRATWQRSPALTDEDDVQAR